MDRQEDEFRPGPAGGPALRQGLDRQGLVRLWQDSRRWLSAVLYAHKPRDVDLEDLMQEVAVKLVRHIHELNLSGDAASVRPWLRTVAINVARSAGRKTRVRDRFLGDVQARRRRHGQPGAEDIVDRRESAEARGARALELAMTLPPAYREPLLLNLRGLSQRQISQVMDIPVTTIETRLIRARRMLRDELEREDETSSALRPPSSEAVRASA